MKALLDRGDEGASLMAPLKFYALWWILGTTLFVGMRLSYTWMETQFVTNGFPSYTCFRRPMIEACMALDFATDPIYVATGLQSV